MMGNIVIRVLGLVDIAIVIVSLLWGWHVDVHRIDISFDIRPNALVLGIDPVFIIRTPPWLMLSNLHASGMAVGDVVFLDGEIKLSYVPCLLEHELNHVWQYRALGEFYPVGMLFLNLEGRPYYGMKYVCTGLPYMWHPPAEIMWWHLVYFTLRTNQ